MAIQVFGSGNVQSAFPAYLALDITANSLTLVWSDAYVDVPYTDPVTGIHYQALAANMNVTTSNPNVHTITLPDATQTSIGTNFIMTNVGAANFTLNTSDGMPLQDPVTTGVSYYVLLTDNSTSVGVWTVYTFAAGTSEASAVALAGNGLVALAGKLNTNVPVISTAIVPVIDVTSRAKLIVWTGGIATLILPTIISVPAGYYVSFSNQGTAQLTIEPGEPGTTISLEPSLAVQVQQSLTIISDGANWQTLGFGQNQADVVTALSLNVSLSVNVTLTSTQAANLIQEYNGLLTANITVFFPVITGEWFIANNTTGTFTLSVQLAGPLGTAYVIPQGSSQIFYSDGTSLFIAPTSLSLANGTVTSPALSFVASSNTGIYYNDSIVFSIGGVNTAAIETVGPLGEISALSANGTSMQIISANTTGSIDYNAINAISINNAGAVTLPVGPLTLSAGQFLIPNGTVAAPAIAFSSNMSTGFYYTAPAIGISIGGVLAGGFQASGTTAIFSVFSANTTELRLTSSNTSGSISYNSINAISIDPTGAVTLPAAPLPISSGGTNANNQQSAIKNIMPTAAAGGIPYFDGTNWQVLPIGTPNQTLTVNNVTNLPYWAGP